MGKLKLMDEKQLRSSNKVRIPDPFDNMNEVRLQRAGITQAKRIDAIWKFLEGDQEDFILLSEEMKKLHDSL